MLAEERSRFLCVLRRNRIGTADIEDHALQQAKLRRNGGLIKRNVKTIQMEMRDKIRDARIEEGKERRNRDSTRRKVEGIFGRNSARVRNIIKRIKCQIAPSRAKLKLKYSSRTKHLRSKYNPDSKEGPVPHDLTKYSEADVFSKDYTNNRAAPDHTEGQEVLIIGDVQLSDEEMEVLKLPPKFAILDKLDDELAEVELQACSSKHRWEASKLEEEDLVDMTDAEKERFDKEMEIIEAKARQMYCPETNTIDMAKLKATDVKTNTRITLPKPGSTMTEAMIAVREEAIRRIRARFKEEHCNEEGFQKSPYLQQKS